MSYPPSANNSGLFAGISKNLSVVQESIPVKSASQPVKPSSAKKGVVKQTIKIVVSLALLALLLHYTGIEDTFARLSTANLWYIPAGIVLFLLAQLISSYRWKFLCKALDFRLSFRELYDYYLIGMFFNMFLPGSIGGDAVRMFYLAKRTNRRKREALLTLLAERGVGLVALLLLTSVVCLTPSLMAMDLALPVRIPGLASPVLIDIRVILLSLSSCMVLGYLLFWVLPLQKLVQRIPALDLLLQAKVYWAKLGLLFRSVSISLLVHALMISIHALIAVALHIHVPILYLAVIYGVVSLASVLPIAMNGFGVREGIYWLLLTKAGLSKDTALAFALYWDAISMTTSLLGGLILLKGHYRTPTAQETELVEA